MMVTEQGMIKKTPPERVQQSRARPGIGAIGLGKGDKLIDVRLTDGSQDIVIGTHEGLAIRFHETGGARDGRTRGGRAGDQARKEGQGHRCRGAEEDRNDDPGGDGEGIRQTERDRRVPCQPPGGKGIFTVKTTEKTGRMVAIREVLESDDIVIVTSGGIVIRQHASEVRLAGRNTQGVRLIKLGEGRFRL